MQLKLSHAWWRTPLIPSSGCRGRRISARSNTARTVQRNLVSEKEKENVYLMGAEGGSSLRASLSCPASQIQLNTGMVFWGLKLQIKAIQFASFTWKVALEATLFRQRVPLHPNLQSINTPPPNQLLICSS